MSRKGESITLSLSATDKAALEAIALQYGCVWGEKANLSELNRRIASGELLITEIDSTKESKPAERIRGKKAIASIVQGLLELSAIWFG